MAKDVLLEGGPRHQHHVRLPEPLPDVLVEDTGEYVRMGDSEAYAWVGQGDLGAGYAALREEPDNADPDVEHVRPAAPPARTHAPTQGREGSE